MTVTNLLVPSATKMKFRASVVAKVVVEPIVPLAPPLVYVALHVSGALERKLVAAMFWTSTVEVPALLVTQ